MKRTLVNLTDEQHAQLKKEATKAGISMSALLLKCWHAAPNLESASPLSDANEVESPRAEARATPESEPRPPSEPKRDESPPAASEPKKAKGRPRASDPRDQPMGSRGRTERAPKTCICRMNFLTKGRMVGVVRNKRGAWHGKDCSWHQPA